MAVTVARFKLTFSEFRKTADAEIEAKLALARLEVNTTVWGAKADSGVLYLTAHKVEMAPAGENAKLVPKDGSTIYLKEYRRLMRQVSFGLRTAGLPSSTSGIP